MTAAGWVLGNGWEQKPNLKFWNKQTGETVTLYELLDLYAEYCVSKQFVSTSE